MLDQHINLGKALRPFSDYEMDHAIGTSYSLSLEALMFIPVTLFYGDELETQEKILTSDLLETLTKIPNQVQMFCQRGKMIKPSFYHNILAFWENSVYQVHLDSHLRSFHPKIWLVRYKPLKEKLPVRYKMICTSRNLTLCRDWDMAVCMEGNVTKSKYLVNKPLLEFVQMLDEQIPTDDTTATRKKIKQEILDEIMHINFELNDADQLAYDFHPIGFKGKKHPLLDGRLTENLLIVSPFLDRTTLDNHRKHSRILSIYSNAYELNKIAALTFDDMNEVYMFNPLLDQPAYAEPEAATTDATADKNTEGNVTPDESYNPSMNLHAKLYIAESKKQASWFVGSANCTNPATARNIEFLTEIKFQKSKMLIDSVRETLVKPTKGQGMFIKYESFPLAENDLEKQNEAQLRKLIYDLAGLQFVGTTKKRTDGKFNLEIFVDNATFDSPEGWKVTIVPLSGNQHIYQPLESRKETQRFLFQDFDESQLSPFILCTITYAAGMIKNLVLDINIAFDESRMRKIFTSIIKDRDKLYKYLSAILAKEETIPLSNLEDNKQESGKKKQTALLENYPLYEKLLLAASRNKSKIRLAAKTIEYLKGETDEHGNLIVEESFAAFFEVFKPFADEV